MLETNEATVSLCNTIDVEDFSVRWKRARLGAIRKFLQNEPPKDSEELGLLENGSDGDLSELLKSVYYNSRKLGLSALSHYNLLWELSDLPGVFENTRIPCFFGEWSEEGTGRKTLRRFGCEAFKRCGSKACDFYREAVDGLLVGVGDEVRHVRHASLGHGDAACVDVFFARRSGEPVYLPIPAEILIVLEPIRSQLEAEHVPLRVTFKGYAEGTVYAEVVLGRSGCSAGAEEADICLKLINAVREKLPHLNIQNSAPTSVFDKVLGTEQQEGEKKKWNRILG